MEVEDSARHREEHPDAMREALARHDGIVARSVEERSGTIVRRDGGDTALVVFERASDAVAAALSVQRAVLDEAWPPGVHLRVRAAVHTGELEVAGGDYGGPVLSRGARLRQAAHGGQILVSEAVRNLAGERLPEGATLEDLGLHVLQDLGPPERLFELRHPCLRDLPAPRTLTARPNNLPSQPTPLVGRDRELREARELLLSGDVRLLTFVGTGGIGKTRLALQVAAELIGHFEHGAWFVPLADVTQPGRVISSVAKVLDIQEVPGRTPLETVQDALAYRDLLIVLDNFEQLVEAGIVVAEILGACPKVKIVVTSRVPLHVRAEQEFPVPPLSLPERGAEVPPGELARFGAVSLFVKRSHAVDPHFALGEDNAALVRQICARLDGLPLAIELAAARIKLLPLDAILSRLERRFGLLTGGARDMPTRHQTLRAAIDWSYSLLPPADQALMARLAVFVGGFALEAAEAVCDPAGDLEVPVLDGVASLVDHSLARRDELDGGEPRFGMLETIREFALESLAARGEADELSRRHAEWFADLAEDGAARLEGEEQVPWLDRLEREHDNLRAALRWCSAAEGDADLGLRLAAAMSSFWYVRGYLSEGRAELELALSRGTAAGEPRMRAVSGLGTLAREQGDYDIARGLFSECLEAARQGGDKKMASRSLSDLAEVVYLQGEYESGLSMGEEALALARELAGARETQRALSVLGMVERDKGVYTRARSLYEESLLLARDLANRRAIGSVLTNLGIVAGLQGDYDSARSLSEESLDIARELGGKRDICVLLGNLGAVADVYGDYGKARSLYEEGLALARKLGHRRAIATLVENLGSVAQAEGDAGLARLRFDESLRLYRELGDKQGIAHALCNLAVSAVEQGELDAALDWAEECRSVAHELGDQSSVGQALNVLGDVARGRGDLEGARNLCASALEIAQELGNRWETADSLSSLAAIAHERGELDEARGLLEESLSVARGLENRRLLAALLEQLGRVVRLQGQPDPSARLLGAAEEVRETIGAPRPPADRESHEAAVWGLREALGEDELDAAWAAGRALTLDAALAEALAPSIAAMVRQRSPDLGEPEVALRTGDVQRLYEQHAALLASVTHEFRTPLFAILGYAEMLLDPGLRPDEAGLSEYAKTIKDSGEHILTLVNDLCDLGKLEQGKLELELEAIELAPAVDGVRAMLASLASEGGLELVVDVPPGLPPVLAQPTRLTQVLLNLCSNAIKYTPEGGRVLVGVRRGDGHVAVSVEDTGVGIPPEAAERIFEPFYQVPGTVAQRGRASSGLGLALTKALVEAHGGEIGFESEPGRGTTFTFTLRAAGG